MWIIINKWDKFNPRKDLKTSSWFRLENNFLTHPSLWDLSSDGKMVWIGLLCDASRRQSSCIEANSKLLAALLKTTASVVEDAFSALQDADMIEIHTSRPRNVRVTSASRPRNARVTRWRPTDITDEHNGRDERTNKTSADPGVGFVDPGNDLILATAWLEYAKAEMPWRTDDKSWSPQVFAADLAQVQKKCGLTDEGMMRVLEFIRADDFWHDKACNPKGLLGKSKNGQRKIDNILVRMKSDSKSSSASTAEAIQRWADSRSTQGDP
jgi:hypothetical protein